MSVLNYLLIEIFTTLRIPKCDGISFHKICILFLLFYNKIKLAGNWKSTSA